MKLLVVDDERAQREILGDILRDAGYDVKVAENGKKAFEMVENSDINVILTDLKMPEMDGVGLLNAALSFNADIQVIIMTAFGSIPGAVSAIKKGAYDYLAKPFQKDDLLRIVKRAMEKANLLNENRCLKKEISDKYSYGQMIGKSREMQTVFQLIERVKDIQTTCLIIGESGTGKELVARAIHYNGRRKEGPFVALNCGAIPENLIESELFGYEKGAFTGAGDSRPGKFEQAQGGTIFLDEIGIMRLDLQTRLLRVLEDKRIQRLGSSFDIILDVRVIAATNTNLESAVKTGLFRNDLYHRLNVFEIQLPELKNRKGDIPLLINFFLQEFSERYDKDRLIISPKALSKLESYSFPGNIRELENILEKAVILTDKSEILPENLSIPEERESKITKSEYPASLPDTERLLIEDALSTTNGSIKKAASSLGISYKTLQYRLKKFSIDKRKFRL